MKTKTPPFEELIERLVASINKRNPGKELKEEHILLLRNEWKGRDKELYKLVKTLEQNEFKAESLSNNYSKDNVEFVIGYTLSGEPIIVTHVVERYREFEQVSKFSKRQKEKNFVRSKAFLSRSIF